MQISFFPWLSNKVRNMTYNPQTKVDPEILATLAQYLGHGLQTDSLKTLHASLEHLLIDGKPSQEILTLEDLTWWLTGKRNQGGKLQDVQAKANMVDGKCRVDVSAKELNLLRAAPQVVFLLKEGFEDDSVVNMVQSSIDKAFVRRTEKLLKF